MKIKTNKIIENKKIKNYWIIMKFYHEKTYLSYFLIYEKKIIWLAY